MKIIKLYEWRLFEKQGFVSKTNTCKGVTPRIPYLHAGARHKPPPLRLIGPTQNLLFAFRFYGTFSKKRKRKLSRAHSI